VGPAMRATEKRKAVWRVRGAGGNATDGRERSGFVPLNGRSNAFKACAHAFGIGPCAPDIRQRRSPAPQQRFDRAKLHARARFMHPSKRSEVHFSVVDWSRGGRRLWLLGYCRLRQRCKCFQCHRFQKQDQSRFQDAKHEKVRSDLSFAVRDDELLGIREPDTAIQCRNTIIFYHRSFGGSVEPAAALVSFCPYCSMPSS
jgi:hypothetical protein